MLTFALICGFLGVVGLVTCPIARPDLWDSLERPSGWALLHGAVTGIAWVHCYLFFVRSLGGP